MTESDTKIEFVDRCNRERRERELNPDMGSSKASTKLREEILEMRNELSLCHHTTVKCARRILGASRRVEAIFSDGDGCVLEKLRRQTLRLLMALEKYCDHEVKVKEIKEILLIVFIQKRYSRITKGVK